jgi:putative transposase
MPRPLSDDLRVRLVEAVEAGGTIRAVGERFGVAPSSVSKIHQRWRRTGSVTAAAMGGDRRSGATEAYGPRILALLEAQPDLTLDEICAALGPAGSAPSRVSIWRFFRRHGISVKKNGARGRAGAPGRGGAASALAAGAASAHA